MNPMILKIITEEQLAFYGQTGTLSEKAISLVNHQKANWPTASENYESLQKVQIRRFVIGDSHLECQFNPGRIRSSTANTSHEAVISRPCFLCNENRPAEQTGILFSEKYLILTNPFPIFPYHLTISSIHHTPQRIEGNVYDFLELSRQLDQFTVFYNGPRCGASAPDHLHFQAGLHGLLPVVKDLETLPDEITSILFDSPHLIIHAVDDSLRRFLHVYSDNADTLALSITEIITLLRNGPDEPMINILGWHSGNFWHVLIFPRQAQRPWQYFAPDPQKILISPAAVELGGIIVLPRKEDFFKIQEEDLRNILSQVTIPEAAFKMVQQKISDSLKGNL